MNLLVGSTDILVGGTRTAVSEPTAFDTSKPSFVHEPARDQSGTTRATVSTEEPGA